MKPRDIKRLEKCVAYYGMIVALLDKCEDSIDFEDKFMSDVIRQMSDSARADKVFLEGKIKAVKEEWK